MKTITEEIRKIYETYSLLVDKLFDVILGPEKKDNSSLVYCAKNYTITTGGSLLCLED